ncbi:MAG: MarC family protein [Hasllibacter sp.]
MDWPAFFAAFVTLFVTIDPVGTAPLVPALTQGMTQRQRTGVAIRAAAIGAAILTLFGLTGEAALTYLGVSLPAFRIAGGLLLFLIAVDMLFQKRTERREQTAGAATRDDPSVFPLAIPFLAGPGAITTMILLAGRADDGAELLTLHLAMLAAVAIAIPLFMAAGLIERLLGPIGIAVLTRLLGLLVAAIAVQFVLSGLLAAGLAPGPR